MTDQPEKFELPEPNRKRSLEWAAEIWNHIMDTQPGEPVRSILCIKIDRLIDQGAIEAVFKEVEAHGRGNLGRTQHKLREALENHDGIDVKEVEAGVNFP